MYEWHTIQKDFQQISNNKNIQNYFIDLCNGNIKIRRNKVLNLTVPLYIFFIKINLPILLDTDYCTNNNNLFQTIVTMDKKIV